MTKKKSKIYKKKGNVVKDLTKNIFRILNEDSSKVYNHKQMAAKLKITDTDGKNQIIQKLAELTSTKKIKEIDNIVKNTIYMVCPVFIFWFTKWNEGNST